MLTSCKADPVAIAPTLQGTYGRAWRTDLEAVRRKLNINPADDATLDMWLVEAAWAHPAWHSYVISLAHLRTMPDARETKIYLEGATHELIVHALDPDKPRLAALEGGDFKFLSPANFAAQLLEQSDELARERVRGAVAEIVAGVLSPDTDFLREWIKRFGDNMVKREWRPDSPLHDAPARLQ